MTRSTLVYTWYLFDKATTKVALTLGAFVHFLRLNTYVGRQIFLMGCGAYVVWILDDHAANPVLAMVATVFEHLSLGAQILTISVLSLMFSAFFSKRR